jgi:polyisoprenoid-binding protein YceI
MGFAKVRGRFADFAGAIRYVDGDIAKTSATVIIKTVSLDTDHDFRDKDLKSANWFDVEKFPIIKFQSKRVENGASGTEVIGDLTIKDVTKEVRIKMEGSSGVQKDIREDTQIIFTGSTTIDRKEFGVMGENWSRVKEGMTAVASEVEIELSILGKQINAPNFRNRVRNVEMPQGKIYQTITTKGLNDGLKEFDQLKAASTQGLNENTLNTVGYMLLKEGKFDDALKVLVHNSACYPNDPNLFDSLAEGYAWKDDKTNAIKYYKMSIEKDPLNANAIEILRHLEE